MEKEFRIQVRTEVYETYVIKVNKELGDSPNSDEEALEIALSKLDKAYGKETDDVGINKDSYEVYIEDTITEFGGFTSIQDGQTKLLGKAKAND